MSSDSTLSLEPLVMLPPDGGYGWVVVVTCFLMNLFTDGAIYTFGFYQKNMQDDFDKDSAAVALLASLCSGFYYVAAPVWSAVGNRWGFRTVSVVGALASGGALLACFFITQYAVFILVYGIVLGAASGGVYVATMISVGFYFERWRGVATSLTSCGSGVGILVMPLCYKAMSSYEGYTWRWILAFNASVFGVVVLLSLLLKPLQPVAMLCPHAVTSTLAALLHHSILTNSVFIVFAFTQVFVMMGYFTPYLFSQDQAVKSGVDPSVAEWILPTLGVANAVGRALSGVMCEVPGVSALVLSCITMSIAGIMVAITCLCASPIYQMFMASAYGFFIAPFMAMKSLILVDFLGIERLTNSFGLLLMFQGFAVMIGPPLSGWIHDITQSYHYVYLISGSLLFIASLLPYLMYPLSNYEQRKEIKQASRRSS
ncbi:monocarboxylate transporter 14-like [Thrips palmi]|uniref:Monocarboxylate transporter 14-like n=1 Tax=Thrips palmi TaxID=161013 RepID=A0A6P9A6Y8_THRPL|nr:monocarboxylate transporter 14-like [Thrips palmi]